MKFPQSKEAKNLCALCVFAIKNINAQKKEAKASFFLFLFL